MNIRNLQIKAHSAVLIFSLIKRKMAFLLLFIFFLYSQSIFSYMKHFLSLLFNKLDALILDHTIFYYSLILTINVLVIANACIKQATGKVNDKNSK